MRRIPTAQPEVYPEDHPISPRHALPLLVAHQLGRCADCACPLAHRSVVASLVLDTDGRTVVAEGYRRATVDHLIPQSAGGTDTWGNYEAVCQPCNQARWNHWRTVLAAV